MKIGIFTDAYEPHISGVTTSIKMLKTALEKMHHEVYIVTANLDNNKFIYDKKNKIILETITMNKSELTNEEYAFINKMSFESEEEKMPIATYTAASKIRPVNEPQKAPLSMFPTGSARYETIK